MTEKFSPKNSDDGPRISSDDHRDHPLGNLARKVREEILSDPVPDLVLPGNNLPMSVNRRRLEIDVAYKNAQFSQEYRDKLANPGLGVKLGRRALNAIGVRTSGQKALEHHEGIVANYFDETGVGDTSVRLPGQEHHEETREAVVKQELDRGAVTERTYAELIDEANPELLAHRKRTVKKLEILKALSRANSTEVFNRRFQQVVDLEKLLAFTEGRYFGNVEQAELRRKMLVESIVVDSIINEALKLLSADSSTSRVKASNT